MTNLPPTKRCSVCGEEKSTCDFFKSSYRKGGLRSCCKLCDALSAKKYREANKDTLAAKRRKGNKAYKPKNKAGVDVRVGDTFNRLLVIGFHPAGTRGKMTQLECVCECGVFVVAPMQSVTNGHTSSCGCYQREVIGNVRRTHGESKIGGKRVSREYSSWEHMRARCNDPKNEEYKNYGERGIGIASEWNSYTTFLADMGRCPDGRSLDRIDVNKGYHKDNCRWATNEVQQNNKRNNIIYNYNGIVGTATVILRILGKEEIYSRVNYRLRAGYTIEQAIDLPPMLGKGDRTDESN